jgi:phosphoribosyl 1,2-cyclic phosphodiesterase
MRFSLLGSGSAGNAILVSAPTGKLLIDNGLSYKQLSLRAQEIGESLDDLDGVLITHEHGDHVNGLGVLSRNRPVPIFLTRATYDHLPSKVGQLRNVTFFESGDAFSVGAFNVTTFRIAHDAADPVSFVIEHNGCRMGLATDMGSVSNLVRQRLRDCHALILESNYCHDMIRNSPYPPQIIQRIRGNHGHLSNVDMNRLLADLLHDDLRLVVAVHVSQENNTEEKVEHMARTVLKNHPASFCIADQDRPSPMMEILQHGRGPVRQPVS